MRLVEIQSQIDLSKYLESEKMQADMCGKYDYCKHCNKKKKYPCASAYSKERRLYYKELNSQK